MFVLQSFLQNPTINCHQKLNENITSRSTNLHPRHVCHKLSNPLEKYFPLTKRAASIPHKIQFTQCFLDRNVTTLNEISSLYGNTSNGIYQHQCGRVEGADGILFQSESRLIICSYSWKRFLRVLRENNPRRSNFAL